MKKFLCVILSVLLLTGIACAEEVQTRESIILIEGYEETIVETLYESPQGFRIWYPADLFAVTHEEGSDYFDSDPEIIDVGLAIVDAQISHEFVDEMVDELIELSIANNCQIIGEVEQWELASGATVKRVNILFEDYFNHTYYVYGTQQVFCITCYYPVEAAEGWGTRIEQMISTFEWTD